MRRTAWQAEQERIALQENLFGRQPPLTQCETLEYVGEWWANFFGVKLPKKEGK